MFYKPQIIKRISLEPQFALMFFYPTEKDWKNILNYPRQTFCRLFDKSKKGKH